MQASKASSSAGLLPLLIRTIPSEMHASCSDPTQGQSPPSISESLGIDLDPQQGQSPWASTLTALKVRAPHQFQNTWALGLTPPLPKFSQMGLKQKTIQTKFR